MHVKHANEAECCRMHSLNSFPIISTKLLHVRSLVTLGLYLQRGWVALTLIDLRISKEILFFSPSKVMKPKKAQKNYPCQLEAVEFSR
jgi:hypothetical protein